MPDKIYYGKNSDMPFFETVLIPPRYIFKAANAFIETKPRA